MDITKTGNRKLKKEKKKKTRELEMKLLIESAPQPFFASSRRWWGRALRDNTKNGCEADYY